LTFLGQSAFRGGITFGIVNGTQTPQPRLLSGIFATRLLSNEKSVGASLAVLQFVERLPETQEATLRRWQELISENRRFERDDGFGESLPREIADLLDIRVGNMRLGPDGERLYVARAAKI
jgi:hypothetical protein